MGLEELEGKLSDLQRQIFDLKSQAVTETLENSKACRNARRDIARVKTIIREKKNQ
jgi:large subunit ribosomal protein L29